MDGICNIRDVIYCAATVINQISCGSDNADKKMGKSYLDFFDKFQWGSISGIMPKEYSKFKDKSIVNEVDIIGKLMNYNPFYFKFQFYDGVNKYLKQVPQKFKAKFKTVKRRKPYNKSIFLGMILPAVEECVNQFQEIQKMFLIESDDPQLELFIDTFENKEKKAVQKLLCEGREIMVERIISLSRDLLLGLDRWMFSPFYTSWKDVDVSLICEKDAKVTKKDKENERTLAQHLGDKSVGWRRTLLKPFN